MLRVMILAPPRPAPVSAIYNVSNISIKFLAFIMCLEIILRIDFAAGFQFCSR